MSQPLDVLTVGNAIVDIFARCDDAFLETRDIGKGMMNLVDAPRSAALYADISEAREISGGSAANTAVGIAALGGRAGFAGRVHDDVLGHAFIRDIGAAGVQFTTPPQTDGAPTASSIILVTPDAIRSMNTHLGACIEFQPGDIRPQEVAASKVIYLEGYLFDAPAGPEVFAHVARLADEGTFLELQRDYGGSVVTGFLRIEGRPMGVLANDTRVLGGALDTAASAKASRFLGLIDAFGLPVLSVCDTPGFMVGPDSEAEGAVHAMSQLFVAGAKVRSPWVCVFVRKGYGLGAMAMAGGSLDRPDLTVAWPQGELGAMGLEGAVRLGFARELEAAGAEAREALFDELVGELYARGRATEAASYLEIDAVIDPADTRRTIAAVLC